MGIKLKKRKPRTQPSMTRADVLIKALSAATGCPEQVFRSNLALAIEHGVPAGSLFEPCPNAEQVLRELTTPESLSGILAWVVRGAVEVNQTLMKE